MRDGQLLAESEPNTLIDSYRMRVCFYVCTTIMCKKLIIIYSDSGRGFSVSV